MFQAPGVAFSHLIRLYEPDLIVVPKRAIAGTEHSIAAEHALLVVEITSRSNARHDRTAHGPMPLYLLVDPWDVDGPGSTLFSEPVDGEYLGAVRVPFGEAIALPAPFDIEIETAEFPRP